ncbi:MAG TPA: UDP-N-acetylglucosamine 1-carboxyvinyltransferase [Firmicutes bacterium]|nr:UDP-N-acetylglucosamine 1-carboxyvinyltransferase [Bacillota bacterium]
METILIEGGRRLAGEVRIGGAKNAALPILAAALLTGEAVRLESVPPLDDVTTMEEVLTHLGVLVTAAPGGVVKVEAGELKMNEAPYELVRRMRASFLVMGPLLARRKVARIALPGGCAIGARPIDLHLKGFCALGAEVVSGYGYVEARAERLHGAEIYLDFPSVGATENLMMAASLADGHTTIVNAAKEPEIVDLATFLNTLGARVRGAGTDTIRIEGVRELGGAQHRIIPDRIEAGTYLMAVGAAGGEVAIRNVVARHLEPVIAKAREAGMEIQVESGAEEGENEVLRVRATGTPSPADIITLPYPGFPTDLQPPWLTLMTLSTGRAVVTENVFEDRFRHVEALRRMGARIRVQGRVAEITGVARLIGTRVDATDLRAGAALVVAGLAADGTTEVGRVYHLDRGYANLEANLRGLGAAVERQETPLAAAGSA